MIAAVAASAAIRAEPHEARMLVESGNDVVAIAPDGHRQTLIAGARLATTTHVVEWGPAWSPDGKTIVYTARVGDARQVRVHRLPHRAVDAVRRGRRRRGLEPVGRNADFHLRDARYDNDTASLLVRIRWKSGTPTVTPVRSCRKERC